MSLKCQGDLIVAANVDKSEVIYTLIEPFHPFSRYFATVLCSSIRLSTAWIGGAERGGFWERGALQKLRRLTACRMCSKHDRRLAQSGSAIMSKAAQAQNAKLLGEVVFAMHFSKSDSDALKWMKGALFPGRTDVVTELTLKKNSWC